MEKYHIGQEILKEVKAKFPSVAVFAKELCKSSSATKDLNIITNGILNSYLYNNYTARKENRKTTSHASRGFKTSIGISCHNLILENGDNTQEELISQIKDGILVNSLTGTHAGVNSISGDFSLQAEGIKIENGNNTSNKTATTNNSSDNNPVPESVAPAVNDESTNEDNGTVDVPVETPNTDSSDPLGLGEGQDNPYAGIDFSQYGEMPSYEDAMNSQNPNSY